MACRSRTTCEPVTEVESAMNMPRRKGQGSISSDALLDSSYRDLVTSFEGSA